MQRKLLGGILQNLSFWNQIPNGIFELLITAKEEFLTKEEIEEIYLHHLSPIVMQSGLIESINSLFEYCEIKYPVVELTKSKGLAKVFGSINNGKHITWAIEIDHFTKILTNVASLSVMKKKLHNNYKILDIFLNFAKDIFPKEIAIFQYSLITCPFLISKSISKLLNYSSNSQLKGKNQLQILGSIMGIYSTLEFFLFYNENDNNLLDDNNKLFFERITLLLDLFVKYYNLQNILNQTDINLTSISLKYLIWFHDQLSESNLNWICTILIKFKLLSNKFIDMNQKDLIFNLCNKLLNDILLKIKNTSNYSVWLEIVADLQVIGMILHKCKFFTLEFATIIFNNLCNILQSISSDIIITTWIIKILYELQLYDINLRSILVSRIDVYLRNYMEFAIQINNKTLSITEETIMNSLEWPKVDNAKVSSCDTIKNSIGGKFS